MALEAYRRALETGETFDRRTKIVLIGQDRVGKTSLRRFLRGEAFDKDEASTNGIEMISPVKNAGKGHGGIQPRLKKQVHLTTSVQNWLHKSYAAALKNDQKGFNCLLEK